MNIEWEYRAIERQNNTLLISEFSNSYNNKPLCRGINKRKKNDPLCNFIRVSSILEEGVRLTLVID